MTTPTVAVSIYVGSSGGGGQADARIVATLDRDELYQGLVVANHVTATTDENGNALLHLFPNELGSQGSQWNFKIAYGGKTSTFSASVPNRDCVFDEIVNMPAYPGKPDGQVAMENAIAAAGDAARSATAAGTSASTASTAATNAGNSATAAGTSASTASTAATNAGNNATAAGTSASTASTAATNAGNSATAAGTSASTASTAATNAGNSATAAGTSASTASTAATNAGNSATAAGTSASTASTAATNAGNSATAAGTSASTASTAATNAGNSATAAGTSASNAANSLIASKASEDASAASAAAAANSAASAVAIVTNNLPYLNGDSTISKSQSQCVDLTPATSAATGLVVSDNAAINMGTGNFCPVISVMLPKWTPAAEVILMQKHDGTNGWVLSLLATGKLRLKINATAYDSTVAVGQADGAMAMVAASVTRESASVAGSVVFAVSGIQLGTSVAITAGAPATVSNTVSLYVMGTNAARSEGRVKSVYVYNYAPAVSHLLDLYRYGVAFADQGAAGAELVVNGGFDVDASWTKQTGWTIAGGAAVSAASYQSINQNVLRGVGKRHRAKFDVVSRTGGSVSINIGLGGTATGTSRSTTGSYIEEIISYFDTAVRIIGAAFSGSVDNVSVVQIGAVLALEPEGAMPNQWHDASGNGLHAVIPEGASISRWRESAQYSWNFPITGDTALTSIVPAGYELASVTVQNSTVNYVDVKLGTSAGGTQVLAATTCAANTFTVIQCNKAFSLTAAQTLYLSSAAWSSASITVILRFRRIS